MVVRCPANIQADMEWSQYLMQRYYKRNPEKSL